MRFAANASASNYIAAGRNAAAAAASIQETARAFSPNYTDLATEDLKQQALNFQQKVKDTAETTQIGMKLDANIKLAELEVENAKSRADANSGLRKAGAIAAAGKFAYEGLRKPIERPEFDDGGLRDYYRGKMTGLEQEIADLKEKPLDVYKGGEEYDPNKNYGGVPSRGPVSSNDMLKAGENPSGGDTLGFNQLRALAEQAGFKGEKADIMAAISLGESGGRVAIDTVQSGLDRNMSNEYSIGATQINVQAHGDKLRSLGYTEEDMRDPVKNFQVAKMVHDEVGGFTPWTVFKDKKHVEYLPR